MANSSRLSSVRTLAIVLGILCGSYGQILAQEKNHTAVGLAAGHSNYDLSGTGNTFVVAGRLEYAPVKPLILEAAINYFQYSPQLAGRTDRFLFPEISVQGSLPLGRVWPYIGGGAGFSATLSGRSDSVDTLHAAVGLRVWLPNGWGLRGELRARAIDPWGASTADLTFGLARVI